MKKILLSMSVILICSFNIFAQSSLAKEDYAVYAAVLRDIRLENLKQSKAKYSFVILDDTSTFNPNIFDEHRTKRFRGILRDFKRKNLISLKLTRLFPVKYEYEITSRSEISELLKNGAKELEKVKAEYKSRNVGIYGGNEIIWEPFYKKYPNTNGYYQFSRVDFSSDKSFALVLVEGKGGSWNSSMDCVLRKVKGEWRIYLASGGRSIS